MEQKRIFYYDSFSRPFLGTRITSPYKLEYFKVIANQSYEAIIYEEFSNAKLVEEVHTSTSVFGELINSCGDKRIIEFDHPFNVNIYSYCPVDNLSYRAEVLGIIPMSIKEDEEQQTIQFVAMACIPWRKE